MRALTTTRKRRTATVKVRKNGKHKVDAKSTMNVPAGMNRILRPQARYNWLMPNIGAITPKYIETVLNGALAGNHVQQWWLFDLMLRTWPELSSCYRELLDGVLRKKLIYEAFHEEDEEPTPDALERATLCSTALRGMDPDTQHDGNDLTGTIEDILDAWFRGVAVSEIVWNTVDDKQLGTITVPTSTYCVDPSNYVFDYTNTIGLAPQKKEQKGGGLYPFVSTAFQPQPSALIPFPDNKFLVAIHKAKAGSPLGAALMVPLAWWWCAANFSADWLLNLAQVFGLPFRWASYDPNAPQKTIDDICNMLQNMGSAAWAAFPTPTTVEFMQPSNQGSDHSPQGELMDRADRYCRTLILGQTMTGTHGTLGKGGGQAFGKIEHEVKEDRVDAAGKFACSVINTQLIPSILILNYGDTDEKPTIKFLEDEVADFTEAQRDQILVNTGVPIGVNYMRKKYDIPEPATDEETLTKPEPATPFGGQGFNGDTETPDETKAPNEEPDVKAGGSPQGHAFRGNQYVRLGDDVKTPDGSGKVVANDPDGAWVSVQGTIRKYKTHQLSKIGKPFPSLLPSEEEKRRIMRNAGLQTKLEELNAIDDDAIFSSELLQLTNKFLDTQLHSLQSV